ncbi:DUF397 domain-containing protein [Streptomyces sp. CA-243310]|uniref:DUF397 domain-containing protein n=1 Tax=Streptomyces sp. CA-243310 TaxID=3240056 RepID=UPI003D8D3B78
MPEHTWYRSSHCAEGNACVYVAVAPDGRILVAERGDPGEPGTPGHRVLRTSAAAWTALVAEVRTRS